MKSTFILLAALIVVPCFAAETGPKRTELFKQIDRNKNYKIDGHESAELRDVFAKVPSASPVKKIDSNKNGKLEDHEVQAFSAKYSLKARKK